MPRTTLVLYREADGSVPLLDWFEGLVPKARAKCRVRLQRLAELGHELRRAEAGLLKDGIHELRAKHDNGNYRILYFFQGRAAVVVSHGFSKQQAEVPDLEIMLAANRRAAFVADPPRHTFTEDP